MIAVVIPCYKVSAHICELISRIGEEVNLIFVVDDACPEHSGQLVETACSDPRLHVLYHAVNQGVGGAVLTGYSASILAGAEVIVKIDGDGQMDPALMSAFVAPIVRGEADYAKGNRFFEVETVRKMPIVRLIGNAGLSFLTKLSSGYWDLFDPTNGYTAISAKVAAHLSTSKLNKRYFFESDMLFRLNTMRAVVIDIPMYAEYGNEQSGLKATHEIPRFLFGNIKNLLKRILYNYFLRNFSYATLELVFGIAFICFGSVFGVSNWIEQALSGTYASAGTVMLSALPVIIGLQLLLGFLNYDMASVPVYPLQKRLHFDARGIKSVTEENQ